MFSQHNIIKCVKVVKAMYIYAYTYKLILTNDTCAWKKVKAACIIPTCLEWLFENFIWPGMGPGNFQF